MAEPVDQKSLVADQLADRRDARESDLAAENASLLGLPFELFEAKVQRDEGTEKLYKLCVSALTQAMEGGHTSQSMILREVGVDVLRILAPYFVYGVDR